VYDAATYARSERAPLLDLLRRVARGAPP